MGDSAAIARTGWASQVRRDGSGPGAGSTSQDRYRGGGGHASSQGEAVRQLQTEAERMSERRRWKCRAMDAEENQRQVSLRAHRPWKSQTARFPHSHRRDEAMEKWKTKNRFSTFPLPTICLG